MTHTTTIIFTIKTMTTRNPNIIKQLQPQSKLFGCAVHQQETFNGERMFIIVSQMTTLSFQIALLNPD